MKGLSMTSRCAVLVALAATLMAIWPSAEAADGPARKQLRNLSEKPEKPRFEVTGRVWPEKHGQAHLCLWSDDKLAAFSLTVDDNWAPDHEWWSELGKKHGFPVTWFVITGRVGTGGIWGTWEGWRKLRELGHDMQSHTVDHLHPEKPTWKGMVWEYCDSIKHIEDNMPGHKAVCLAYPGGQNSHLNDRELAAKHYIACRGTVGTPNRAGQIDYLSINATGGFHLGERPHPWADLRNILDPRHRQYYRGWAVWLSHKADRERIAKLCEYVKAHEADIWAGAFVQVARYGQERDTARLQVTKVEQGEVRFTLSDDMDDQLFDFPLTIKARLADDWQAVSATQGDREIEAKLIEHDGAKFALVKAVPDRGEVTLSRR